MVVVLVPRMSATDPKADIMSGVLTTSQSASLTRYDAKPLAWRVTL
jgi:hypothetical protein